MKIYGIVAEYNPFHNGHLYQIDAARKYGVTHIVAVMSGNYVQRGDIAIIDKFKRAELAVKCGVDMVIELPTPFSLATAEIFAKGAVSILGSIGCIEGISFGSECGDIGLLDKAAFAVDSLSNSDEIKALLKKGTSYPNALQSLVLEKFGKKTSDVLSGANNLLGIEYLRAIRNLNFELDVFTVPREFVVHDSTVSEGNLASASFIRKAVSGNNEYRHFVPGIVYDTLTKYNMEGKISDISKLEKITLYKLRMMSCDEIRKLPDVSQGLENRIGSAAKSSVSFEELLFAIKTKRYPLARIRRILLSAVLGIDKNFIKEKPPYGRILAVNSKGCEILKEAKKKSKIPLSTSLLKLAEVNESAKKFVALETAATDIYALTSEKIQPSGMDYTAKIKKVT